MIFKSILSQVCLSVHACPSVRVKYIVSVFVHLCLNILSEFYKSLSLVFACSLSKQFLSNFWYNLEKKNVLIYHSRTLLHEEAF
jgi:hypothetical protein